MVPFWGKSKKRWTYAVHRLICNQQVGGSNPPADCVVEMIEVMCLKVYGLAD